MLLLRLLISFLGFSGISQMAAVDAQDIVGGTGCSTANCVFSNPNLRFGTGAQTSVNAQGLFVQPWYYSHVSSVWYKLTYSGYPLDTAIGTGTGGPNWSGATVVDLYSLTPTDSVTDYSNFVVDSSSATITTGHGKIVANRTYIVNGQSATIENTFSLGATDSFVKIVTRVINNDAVTIQNMMVWTGTRDDYVGTTDSNIKTRGNLDTGAFVAVTTNSQSSHAIMITNTNEGVLFYSETPGVMTAYSVCCSFSNVYNTNPLSLAPSTAGSTDGSYAAVLPVGNIATGASSSIIWYYAAGSIGSLNSVATAVAVDQVADAPSSTATAVAIPTGTGTGTGTGTETGTETGTGSSSATATATAFASFSSYPSATAFASFSSSAKFTTTPVASASSFPTESSTVTPTPTANVTPSPTSSFPIHVIVTEVATLDSLVYLYVFLPLNILVAICCCIGCSYLRSRKNLHLNEIEILHSKMRIKSNSQNTTIMV